MKVDTMRAIDRRVGVPLCALASALSMLLGWLARRPAAPPVRRALFIELSEMGSAILADPAMRRLAERANAELFFAIFTENAASLELLGTVPRANVFAVRSSDLLSLAIDVVRFMAWCRRHEIDTVVDLELFSRFTALLSWLSGAKRRVGFHGWRDEGLYRGDLLTHPVRYNPHRHIATNFLALVETLLEDRRADPYQRTAIEMPALARAPRDEAEIARIRTTLQALCARFDPVTQRLVLVNPNASDLLPQRRWMPERFAAVIRALLRDYDDVVVVLTGAASDRESCEHIAVAVADPRCVSAAGAFQIRELASLYHCAELMLTNDSGPAHFAAVTRLRTYVLFGPETPEIYAALGDSVPIYADLACSPCVSAANHRKTTCTDNKCLQAITAERVLELLRAQLGTARRAAGQATRRA